MFFWEIFWCGDVHGDTVDVMCFFIYFMDRFDFESFSWQLMIL